MAYKVELTRRGKSEVLILDADMARNEGTKSVFYKEGSVIRMLPTEQVDDMYEISDEEAGFVKEPEPEAPVEDEAAPEQA